MPSHPSTVDHARVLCPPAVIILAGFFGGMALDLLMPIEFLPPPLDAILGWPLAVFGAALMATAVVMMRRVGTTVNPFGRTLRLVTGGPFRISRNPIYVGLIFVYIGLSLRFGLLWSLVLLPVVVVVLTWAVIKREERYLLTKFGRAYLDYQARVPRWF